MKSMYTLLDGTKIRFECIPMDYGMDEIVNKMFKVNIPFSEASFINGNGEGVWVVAGKEALKAWKENVEGGVYFVRVCNYSVCYPDIVKGTILPIEMRGDKRPVAIYDEISAKYKKADKEMFIGPQNKVKARIIDRRG